MVKTKWQEKTFQGTKQEWCQELEQFLVSWQSKYQSLLIPV